LCWSCFPRAAAILLGFYTNDGVKSVSPCSVRLATEQLFSKNFLLIYVLTGTTMRRRCVKITGKFASQQFFGEILIDEQTMNI
jgi:hypothetical protein